MRSLRLLKLDTSRSLINGTRSAEEGRDVLKLPKALMDGMCCQKFQIKEEKLQESISPLRKHGYL
jgi:hypothetical protein